ncbi:alpha-glucosidase [Pedobacter sp. UYP30]|uniref:glycoside hydrolase family 31 protein n=1 Tax=Pedobacter sp. UYP30 TaxID=1756400 RepID=UPI00339202C7
MKISSLLLFLSFLFAVTSCSAQNKLVRQVGAVTSVSINGQQIDLSTGQANIQITVYGPSVIRVRMDKAALKDDFSYAVVEKPEKTKLSVVQNNKELTVTTDSIRAVIQKSPFSIVFYNLNGEVINKDEMGLSTSWVGDNVTTYKHLQDDERFIGLGEKTGNLDRRGMGYTNWNTDTYGYATNADPLYVSIPFYIGIHHHLNYGIFLDNTYQTDFNFGASNNRFSSFGARGGEMNYYFIYHKNMRDIIKSYTKLTGRMPMPALWSLGYQQNRYSYYPQNEVLRIARTLREKKIPADGITLDIHYMDKYQLFTWDKSRFPDPVGLTSTLDKLGFKTTVIVDPGIKVEKDAPAYQSGLKNDIFIKYPDSTNYTAQVWPGWCNFPDFTSPKGRSWWENQVSFFAKNGVSGIWNDMNEIATWGQKTPDNILYDYDGRGASNLEAHNVYGLQMSRASYEGAKEQFKKRPFILTRASYAGAQRYAAIWTGDNRAESDHMLAGVRLLTSMGLSGVAFTGMDVGGFTGGASSALFAKWIEIGAFNPYFRNHSALNTKSSEPWTYGEDVLSISRNYISLRYQLMPYLYSSFYEATQNGMPLMRSLAIDNAFDANVYSPDFQNQYQFGAAFMVAPFENGKDFGEVYYPKGAWYSLFDDTKKEGEKSEIIKLTMDELPVFVKAGSIIPVQSIIQSTSEKPTDTLAVHIYNGKDAESFLYYEDDGASFNYEKGDFYKRLITFNPKQKSINFAKAEGNYPTQFKVVKIILHGFEGIEKLDGKNLKNEEYQWLNGNQNIDPQGAASQPKFCKVKTLTLSLLAKETNLNY